MKNGRNKRNKDLNLRNNYFYYYKNIAILILFILLLIYLPTPLWHFPDGIGYYSYLPAIFKYKNYDFYPSIKRYTPGIIGTTKNGFIINDFDIGCSIIWYPVYFFSKIFENENISILFINFFSSLLGLCSLLIFYKFLTKKLNFNKTTSFYICVYLLSGTPLLFYSYAIPQNPHTTACFLCSLFLVYWISRIGNFSYERFLFMGLLLGIISTVRLQRITLILPVIIEFLFQITKDLKNFKKYIPIIFYFIISFLIGISPSLINSKILFSELTIPKLYTVSINKYIFSSLYEVLFSSYHSLLLWTPIILLSILGLIIGIKNNKIVSISLLSVVITEIFISSLVISPGGGASFGIRYYTDLTFIFGVGIYFLFLSFHKLKIYLIIIFFVLSTWSFVLFLLSLTQIIDLLEVYEIRTFFINILEGIKNLSITLKPRHILETEKYLFLSIILLSTIYLTIKIYNLLISHKVTFLYFLLVFYLLFFNYNLIRAGLLNRIVYKKEIFEQSLTLEDYQKFYTLAGINVRLKYYKITKQQDKFQFYYSLKEKLKPQSYFGKRIIIPLFYKIDEQTKF